MQTDSVLPMSREEMKRLGWNELDVLLISGDAYVDHPSFGVALLGRWLNAHGFRVGIVAQPRWDSAEDIKVMGRPRLFVGVTAGALDSMLAHYTAFRKKRGDDAYTPGGRAGARPNRATIVYTNLARSAFPGTPVIIGGIEASLRRATHYDFWADGLRRSLLLDAKADLLLYGMAERGILEVARRLNETTSEQKQNLITGIEGSAFVANGIPRELIGSGVLLETPSHEEIVEDAKKLMTATLTLERQVHIGAWAAQSVGNRTVIFCPPQAPLEPEEMDALYDLPFTREAHPAYREAIPAVEMIKFSVTSHRGCAGGCSFCSLALHQGRRIQSRSRNSILSETERLVQRKDWKGSVSDVGGPSANMWEGRCVNKPGACKRVSCLYPSPCRYFNVDQSAIARLLLDLKKTPEVRHVRVASGIRHDLALQDKRYIAEVAKHFTGGQLKIAPEHVSENVLRLMRKPGLKAFMEFMAIFQGESKRAGKEQYLIPYLLSAFPGCTDKDMEKLSQWLRNQGWRPQQVQCFIPTPGTVATAMYYAGVSSEGESIYVARSDAERMRQHYILAPSSRCDHENEPVKRKRPKPIGKGRRIGR